jgi:hypothetical protein
MEYPASVPCEFSLSFHILEVSDYYANLYYAIVLETILKPAIEVPLSSKMPSVEKKVKKKKKCPPTLTLPPNPKNSVKKKCSPQKYF